MLYLFFFSASIKVVVVPGCSCILMNNCEKLEMITGNNKEALERLKTM